MSKYTLSDEIIAAIARSLQLAMFTGTDVVDHLRLLEVEPDTNSPTTLKLTAECVERTERNVQDLLQRARELSQQLVDQRES